MAGRAVIAIQMHSFLLVGSGKAVLGGLPGLLKGNMLGVLRALQAAEIADEILTPRRTVEQVRIRRHEGRVADLTGVEEVSL